MTQRCEHSPPTRCGTGSVPARCHNWVEFVVGSGLAPTAFLRVLRFIVLLQKQRLQIHILTRLEDSHENPLNDVAFSLNSLI